jgi:cell division protein FtsB
MTPSRRSASHIGGTCGDADSGRVAAKLAPVSDGHRTSTIARPRAQVEDRPKTASRASLLDDFTTPIPIDKQLVSQRRGRLVIALFATVIALAIGAALFVLPIKSWMKQNSEIKTRGSELATLDAANAALQAEVDRLQTDAGIKEAAREEIDYVDAGEQRITVLPLGSPAATLPATWPYNAITQIIALRQAETVAAAEVASASTTSTG